MGTTLTRSACAAGEFRALVAIFLLTVLFADGARANPEPVFPAGPYLRIETGLHTGDIKRIDVDRAERYLITGSLDKTVRVWDLTDGTLLRTLRVPMGSGNLGMIYAVALSPDGRTIAAGGWTGPIAGTDVIYLLDRATGVIKHRITGLESETENWHSRRTGDSWPRCCRTKAFGSMRPNATASSNPTGITMETATGPISIRTGGW